MPTEKQAGFIATLLAEREGGTALLDKPLDEFDVRASSKLIDKLMALPRKPKTASAGAYAHLAGLIQARYALTWERLHLAGLNHLAGHNDQAFFRVNHWKDRVYLDQLKGAAPEFSKVRLSKGDEIKVAALIKEHAHEAVLLFSQVHTCCARCGADLEDKASLAAGLGPTCRGYFGL